MSTRDHPDWWRPVGGQNSQDSTLERRSTLWNDGDPVPPAAPPEIQTGEAFRSKFFTRGARGKIERLEIYCVRMAGGTLDLSFSPHPCIGPLYTLTVTPGAAWAWAQADFQQMWNYDSLFIWVSRCDVDVSLGIDAVMPYDSHHSADNGATWRYTARRLFIRARYSGETPGDVPVSGIINNIRIPNTSPASESYNIGLPSGAITPFVTIQGAGKMLRALFHPIDSRVVLYIDIDGIGAAYRVYAFSPEWENSRGFNDDTPMVQVLNYLEHDICDMQVTIPYEFRRSIRFAAYHTLGAGITAEFRYDVLLLR